MLALDDFEVNLSIILVFAVVVDLYFVVLATLGFSDADLETLVVFDIFVDLVDCDLGMSITIPCNRDNIKA
jgi:hypothetical protein